MLHRYQDLAPDSDYTLTMGAVTSITGVSVTQFTPVAFTTVPTLTFTLDSPDSNVFVAGPPELYHCRPVFTLIPVFNLNAEDKTTIANALSISSGNNLMTKNWSGNNLEIAFSSDLAASTEHTISMSAPSISGVPVTTVTPKTFTTIGGLNVSIASDSGDVFAVVDGNGLYQTLPTFTVTTNMALSSDDKDRIAAAISVSNVADNNITKSWANDTTLNISFTERLTHDTAYTISMADVTNISGVSVSEFADLNFRTMEALSFAVTPDDSNVYAALGTKYRCNPAFTITPNYALSDAHKDIIEAAVSVTGSAVTSKNWDGNNLRVTFSSDLAPDSAYTLTMAAVNSITGVTVTPFASQNFTTVPALTFILNSPDSNVFVSSPSELYHCRPVFTVTPSFNLNAEDKTRIQNAVAMSSGGNLLSMNWSENVLQIAFSGDLANDTEYTLSMNDVTTISGVTVTPFTSKTFRTIEGLNVRIASDSGDVFAVADGNGLYQTLPTFTVTTNMALSSDDKDRIAAAISVSNVADNNITKSWANDTTLNISFTERLTHDTAYTISMADVTNISGVSVSEFADLNFRTMEALSFALADAAGNVFVSSPSELYHCRPSFTVTPNYTLDADNKSRFFSVFRPFCSAGAVDLYTACSLPFRTS